VIPPATEKGKEKTEVLGTFGYRLELCAGSSDGSEWDSGHSEKMLKKSAARAPPFIETRAQRIKKWIRWTAPTAGSGEDYMSNT
jgi:hypothetical protein